MLNRYDNKAEALFRASPSTREAREYRITFGESLYCNENSLRIKKYCNRKIVIDKKMSKLKIILHNF